MIKQIFHFPCVLDGTIATANYALRNLLEELLGEIRDEYDTIGEDPIVKLSDREYLVLSSHKSRLCKEKRP